MELSNTLLKMLQWDALEEIAQSTSMDSTTVKNIATQGLPVLLGQLEKTSQNSQQATSLNTALDDHLWESTIDIEDGKKIFNNLFEADASTTIKKLAKQTWQSQQEVRGVMWALSSVSIETLGDYKQATGGFEVSDLTKLLWGIGKDNEIISQAMWWFDQDGDGDFDRNDMMKIGINYVKKLFKK